MEFKFTRSKAGTIVAGIVAAILGVFMLMNPGEAATTITLVAGWALIITGIAALIGALQTRSVILSSMDLYQGIISLLVGILIVMWPNFFVAWIFFLIGIFIIVDGFNLIFGANAARVLNLRGSGWALVGAILTIVLGFLVLMSPFAMADLTMVVGGVALVYTGVVNIIDGIRMPSQKK